ncbi:hypothetical protein LPJ53_002077 [Coemansia erecta]|uniref:Peptidase S1 domain-containing protein n=1 Tax=Coemansia erecta TaxID=147472 RepID=A0A9W7Y2Y6_9FUNG|nr:hypothetical protein LPJ53_002077 [Coemansia erecta]
MLPSLALPLFFCIATAAAQGSTTSTRNLTASNERIIGGVASSPGDFPSAVSLVIRMTNGVGICGGTLITNSLVLTAAHCVYNYATESAWPARNMRIGYGDNLVDRQSITEGLSVHIHPQFDPSEPRNDIALIAIPPVHEDNAVPAQIFSGSLPPGYHLTAVGWGKTSNDPEVSLPNALRQTDIVVGYKDSCSQFIPSYVSSDGPQICTENRLNRGSDTCQADSGTGVFAVVRGRSYLAGLTSYGANLAGDPACALDDGFAVYTHVAYYRDFIDHVTALVARRRRRHRSHRGKDDLARHAKDMYVANRLSA